MSTSERMSAMADDSPPDSPLSSLSSNDDIADELSSSRRHPRPSLDMHVSYDADSPMPPSKRRKTGASAAMLDRATPSQTAEDDETDISEDGFSSAPGSPSHDEYALRADQITTCQWDGCPIGDLGNSDHLIKHVQNEHISPKRARYTCEWGDCARKGTVHPSGYALKAHMRSHTKEKPFFCALPECDRSFTRSDALAKHMRTVHEPEPSRASATNANPIDPATGLPKKGPKIRLTANGSKSASASASDPSTPAKHAANNPANAGLSPSDPDYDPSPPNDNIQYIPAHHPITGQPGFMITYPPDINFSQFESEIPADQLMRLLRRQLHWAQTEGEELKAENERLESLRREEWVKKEVLLEGVMSGELARAKKMGLLGDLDTDGKALRADMERDVETSKALRWTQTPWWKSEGFSDAGDGATEREARDAADLDRKRRPYLEGFEEAYQRDLSKETDRLEVGTKTHTREDDDMMAVGALMGLSAANTGS